MRGNRSNAPLGICAMEVKVPVLHISGITLLTTCPWLKKLPDRTRTLPDGKAIAVGYHRPSTIVALGVHVSATGS